MRMPRAEPFCLSEHGTRPLAVVWPVQYAEIYRKQYHRVMRKSVWNSIKDNRVVQKHHKWRNMVVWN